MRLGRRRPRPDDTFTLWDVALATGLDYDVVEKDAEWRATESGDKVMTRKQAQQFWHRMVSQTWDAEGMARVTGDPEVVRPLQLDLSILIFADDAVFDIHGRSYGRGWRRFQKRVSDPYWITGALDGSTCRPHPDPVQGGSRPQEGHSLSDQDEDEIT